MSGAVFLRSSALPGEGVAHAFFTRQGGVSTGVYDSLNGGVGSKDDPACVAQNRARMAQALGVPATHLLVPYQIHSPDVLYVREPWAPEARPRVDGLVTDQPGVALGVTGADCGMILFADEKARVIGACHAGWKGAFTGVLEATVEAMVALGADRRRIVAVLGPTIGAASYEVGPEFVARFAEADADYARFFTPSPREAHAMFNLPGFIGMRLQKAGVGVFEDLGLDTYADPLRFFSYRRTTHMREPDYGRLVSAIALA
jgi:YfiH family protein